MTGLGLTAEYQSKPARVATADREDRSPGDNQVVERWLLPALPCTAERGNTWFYGLIQIALAALLLVKSRSGVLNRTPAVAWTHPDAVGNTVMVTVLLSLGLSIPILQTVNTP